LIVDVLGEAERGEIDLSGLWIARERSGRIAGALLTQRLAGKAAAVWPPQVKPSWRRAGLAAALVQEALVDLKARGFRLAQAVLDKSASPHAARDLAKGGMPRVTELLYLERDTSMPVRRDHGRIVRDLVHTGQRGPTSSGSDSVLSECLGLEWCSFEEALEPEFRSVLQATYAGSLDMPELEGVRALDDIMAGYHSAGRFVAERWQLGLVTNRPDAKAVLLLADTPGRNVWEVIYLGLTPAARGHGLGRELVRRAVELARDHVAWLEVAVDLRNKPALRLYETTGFVARDRRVVHLAILGENSG
jgi:ribosomal protein S18 acetylase RimI-like enzyme